MAEININQRIAELRKNKGITQEELAVHLGVTNQTVSKWELAVCCPDIQLLPDIADYFDVTIDDLFNRESINNTGVSEKEGVVIDSVPWDDDDTIRAVVYIGKKLLEKTEKLSNFTFTYNGEAKNVDSHININCGNILGNANAGCDLRCGDVGGNVNAGCDIHCETITSKAVNAGCDIHCDTIEGAVSAGCDVKCSTINGPVSAGVSIIYK